MKWTTNYSAGGVCIIGCTGTSGTALNQLNGPRDLKFDRYGNIYVSDQGNSRILKYTIQLPTSTCPPPSKCYISKPGNNLCIFYSFFSWVNNISDIRLMGKTIIKCINKLHCLMKFHFI
jgi:DNA-binding beta-propeller fold protein YncE